MENIILTDAYRTLLEEAIERVTPAPLAYVQ